MTAPAGVVLGYWQDRSPEENLDVAVRADALGYRELWIGEMATYDAFALATAIGLRTPRIGLTIGPLAVAVRTPVSVAMGVASVAALVGRPVGVALGTSSDVVVEEWHGRSSVAVGHRPAGARGRRRAACWRGRRSLATVRWCAPAGSACGYRPWCRR